MRDMLGRDELITVQNALELLFKHISSKRPAEKNISIEESYGMILSKDIISPEDLPDFKRSTVDGFAVNASETFGSSETLPSYFVVRAEIEIGDRPDFKLRKGEVAKIPTGGMLPEGTDSVIMFEHTQQIDKEMIEVTRPVAPGENVIHQGEDIKKDDCLLKTGHCLRPQDIGAIAGLGITHVWTYEKPRVSIISTGNEIVSPGKPIKRGQIYDINSYTLSGHILYTGGIPVRKGIVSDNYNSIRSIVEESLIDSDMVLISGGSSVGTKDVTANVINDIGEPGVLFHGVSLKPGKPTIGGIINNIPVFGLPGHPAAVTVCFDVFVKPILERLSGLNKEKFQEKKDTITAKITKNISSSPGRQEHIAVKLEERNGEIWAIPLLGKSGLITNLTKADGITIIPLRELGIKEGDIVEVKLF